MRVDLHIILPVSCHDIHCIHSTRLSIYISYYPICSHPTDVNSWTDISRSDFCHRVTREVNWNWLPPIPDLDVGMTQYRRSLQVQQPLHGLCGDIDDKYRHYAFERACLQSTVEQCETEFTDKDAELNRETKAIDDFNDKMRAENSSGQPANQVKWNQMRETLMTLQHERTGKETVMQDAWNAAVDFDQQYARRRQNELAWVIAKEMRVELMVGDDIVDMFTTALKTDPQVCLCLRV